MAQLPIELRRRILDAYQKGLTATYEKTAEVFGVGRATVNRTLRRHRETGDVLYKPRGGNTARVGEKSQGKRIQGRWETMTMIGALSLDGFRGFISINSATTSEVFRAFVKHQLAPNLRPGDVVVLDNLSAHKDKESFHLIRAAGADVLFLPPYSPEYNPIERAWAKMKELLRRLKTRTREAFEHALKLAMEDVSTNDFLAWAAFAGYRLDST
jgi:transposase